MLAARSERSLKGLMRKLESAYPGRVAYCVTDLRSPESIHALFDETHARFGPVDVLVNNAALQIYKPFVEWSEEEIADTVNVNLTALMLATQLALRDMLGARRGLVINIGSDLSRRYLPNMAPYVGTKFGVLGFGGSVLREVKGRGVKVCTIMPGVIETRLSKGPPHGKAKAMRPALVAQAIAELLDQPEHVVFDEVMLHAILQDF